ncbi:MAG: calcium-binding protein [Waterburya sp.]
MSNQLLNFNDLNTQDSNVINGTDGNDVFVTDFENFSQDMSGLGEEIANSVETSIAEAGIINGTASNDNLTGTIVSGLEGNDTLMGDGGAILNGNEGDDQLTGGTGANILAGDVGNDILHAGGSKNVLLGGDGNDNDTIFLNDGTNGVGLMAGTGHDVLNNFKVGSTTLFVENMDQLSFVDAPEGTHIMQGEDLIAVSAGVSSEVFTQNIDAIFEPYGESTTGSSFSFDDPAGTIAI